MKRLLLLAVGVLAVAVASVAFAGAKPLPEQIALPNGFQPEGIAIGPPATFYVGSIPTGAVYRGSLRSGEGSLLVQAHAGRNAVGVDLDQRDRLFVAGGVTGDGYVYDAATGEDIASFELTSEAATFINDVIVTKDGAYFTDSVNPFLYRVPIARDGTLGTVEAIPLSGDLQYLPPPAFNVNGIDATPNGHTLVVVQTATGLLFTVDPKTGVTREINLGSDTVAFGDGILLDGKTLYVVQNQLHPVAVIRLSSQLASGKLDSTLTHPDLDVPTTIDEHGNRLYAVNARFTTPPEPDTMYWVTQLHKQ